MNVIVEPEDLEPQPEDTGLGFMEFFDWLAGTSDEELCTLAEDLTDLFLGTLRPSFPLGARVRQDVGLLVWGRM